MALPEPNLVDPHLPARIAGGLLLVAGARLYRLAVAAPGIAAGAWIATELPLPGPEWKLAAAVVLGAIGAAILLVAERLAVSAAGALVAGGAVLAVAPALLGAPAPWWAALAGALVGAVAFPRIWRALLPLLTSILGALLVTWAMGRSHDLALVAGLAVGGALLQLVTGQKPKENKQ